jgi:hypothetical protein
MSDAMKSIATDTKWIKTPYGYMAIIPIITYKEQPNATYEIYVERRPHYCDRGDWIIYMDGRNDIDAADGFPRYFIGSDDEVKRQMEKWLSRRKAYQKKVDSIISCANMSCGKESEK